MAKSEEKKKLWLKKTKNSETRFRFFMAKSEEEKKLWLKKTKKNC
jgi:hypothetical protein